LVGSVILTGVGVGSREFIGDGGGRRVVTCACVLVDALEQRDNSPVRPDCCP
jgi:hypothetical protein